MTLRDISTADVDIGAAIDEGLQLCRTEQWQEGMEVLWKIARKQERSEKLPSIYYSYAGYGAAKLDRNIKEGISLCRYALRLDSTEPDNYLNLARVEMLRHNRRNAIKALKKGLRIRPGHARLVEFEREIGSRRRPAIPLLARDNRLNIWLGKRRHLRKLEQDRPG